MADIAQSAVLVSSAASKDMTAELFHISGPTNNFRDAQHLLESYRGLGFQATHLAQACAITRRMLTKQPASKNFILQQEQFVEAPPVATEDGTVEETYPTIFLGMTANLLGTGCREALRFVVQEGVVPREKQGTADKVNKDKSNEPDVASDLKALRTQQQQYITAFSKATQDADAPAYRSFLGALVVSAGGIEHDIRRACAGYRLSYYPSEGRQQASHSGVAARFGNVEYGGCDAASGAPAGGDLFGRVMHKLVGRLVGRQRAAREAAAARPTPEPYFDVCSWATTPSEVWALAGIWLIDIMTEALAECRAADTPGGAAAAVAAAQAEAAARARGTVVYWAALQDVPIFSPSFVDGDIMLYITQVGGCVAAAQAANTQQDSLLKLDLVRDIHAINKLAMLSKCTGMIICGGGVVKHHICNANLMRNGADMTVLLNNGQEFDGSDAGARPEEAISWGKIRLDGEAVKVYSEVTITFPLLVAQTFLPAVRMRRAASASSPLTS